MKQLFLTLTFFIAAFFATQAAQAQCVAPGDTSVYGDHAWNVYAFNSGFYFDLHDGSSWSQGYSGYYVDTAVNFDPSTKWNPNISPSVATGYMGCAVNKTTYSWSAKRQGFACGVYDLKMNAPFGEAQLFVDGVLVFDNITNGTIFNWTGFLNDSSQVIFRITTGGGFGYGTLQPQLAGINADYANGNCPGANVQLTAPAPGSYLWNTGDTTQSISVTEGGTYTVDIATNGCIHTFSQEIFYAGLDTPVLQILNEAKSCYGPVQVVISNVNYSLTYTWNSPNVTFDEFNGIYFLNGPGDYELTVSKPGCSAVAHLTIAAPAYATDAYGKNQWTVNAFSLTNGNPLYYAGYYTDTAVNFDIQDKWDPLSNPSTAEGYQGCTLSDDKISWSAQRHGFPCGEYQIDVSSHDDSARLYIDGELVWESISASSSPVINAWTGILTSASNIQFINTNDIGVSQAALSFNKLSTAASLITLTGNSITCTGQFYTLTSIAGASYLWSNGTTANPLLAGESGSYSLTLVDSNGCSLTSDTVSVTVLPDIAPVSQITASAANICNFTPVVLTSGSTTGNYWITNDTTQSIVVTFAGDFSLTVRNSVGCYDVTSVHISEGFTPPQPIASNDGPVCSNYPATLKTSGLAPGGKVLSLNGSTYVLVNQQTPQNNFLPQTNFTVELWIKTTELFTGILSAYDMEFGGNDHALFIANGALYAFNAGLPIIATASVNDGVWHHIAWVVESGAGEKIYVDGTLSSYPNNFDQGSGSTYHTLGIGFSIGPLLLFNNPNIYFKGEMDNLRIWKEARSEATIRDNMFLETPLSSANLQYQFNFNGTNNAMPGNNGEPLVPSFYGTPDYFLYTWSGAGAPAPSTSESQLTSSLTQSGTYQVTASLASCAPSVPASTTVTVSSSISYYPDLDGDGYGDVSASPITQCTSPGAGYVNNNTDCNDNDPARHPGLTETCNGIDDNCNGQADEGIGTVYYADADGDGFGNPNASLQACVQPSGYITDHADCNDANGAAHPGAVDFCNGIDDNCDGVVDEHAFTASVTPAGTVTSWTGTPVTLSANTGSGLYYVWYRNGKLINGASGSSYTTTKAGHYAVSESNLICFAASSSTIVKLNALPPAVITHTGSLNLCGNPTLVLHASSGTGFTYQWIKGTTNIAGATSQSYSPTTKGTYKVKVTNSSLCSKLSAGVKVTKSCKEDGNDEEDEVAFSLYPNPTDGHLVLELTLGDQLDGEAFIIICNGLGQIVYDQKALISAGTLHEEIQLGTSLANGVYFIKVSTGDQRFVKQLVLQR